MGPPVAVAARCGGPTSPCTAAGRGASRASSSTRPRAGEARGRAARGTDRVSDQLGLATAPTRSSLGPLSPQPSSVSQIRARRSPWWFIPASARGAWRARAWFLGERVERERVEPAAAPAGVDAGECSARAGPPQLARGQAGGEDLGAPVHPADRLPTTRSSPHVVGRARGRRASRRAGSARSRPARLGSGTARTLGWPARAGRPARSAARASQRRRPCRRGGRRVGAARRAAPGALERKDGGLKRIGSTRSRRAASASTKPS